MIDALIAGRLYGTPQARTSKAGHTFVTAKVRTPMANGESAFVNVVAFAIQPKPHCSRWAMATPWRSPVS